jgi:hypothetical protein
VRIFFTLLIWAFLSLVSACGGGGGSASATPTPTPTPSSNEMTMTVEKWASNSTYPNQGYVSLEICIPQTSTCQTIDHVLVDTGSYGLRLMSSSVSLNLSQLAVNSVPLAECAQFVSGYTWGGVFSADISLGSAKAESVPIQIINGNYAQTPSGCSSTSGVAMNTASSLGANGILGVGSYAQDCPSCVSQALAGHYYVCSGSSCSASTVPLASQVTNPVALLSSNNNGVVIDLPSATSTEQSSLTGKLVFGIGSSSNNTISTQTVFPLNSRGFLTTTYGANTYSQSYIDSGSNGIFFTDSTIRKCSGSPSFFCPLSTLSKTASISSGSVSKTVNFSVSTLSNFAVQPNLAGTGSSFAWGLPFFYGRKVFVSISGKSAFGSTSPSVAF